MKDHMSATEFHLEFESSPIAVRTALGRIIDGLGPLSLDPEEIGTIEIVMAEALNNVVEHAYPEGDPPGPVEIDCAHRDSGLHFRVIDRGRPLPNGDMPIGEAARVDVDMMDMPEGGFGWFIIKDLAREVQYQRRGEHNVLNLRLAVAKAA